MFSPRTVVCFAWTNILVSASSWLQEQRPDRLILLLLRTFPQCVAHTIQDGCKDVIRSDRKEDNYVLSSLKRRKFFQDFGVMHEPTTFLRIHVPRFFRVSDFKLFKYDVNPRTFACLALDMADWHDSHKLETFMWRFGIQQKYSLPEVLLLVSNILA